MVPAMPALQVESVTRRYEVRVAVRDLSFSLEPGTILGLVGPNGAGKTTTLRSIAGVLPLQQGRIVVDGADLATEELAAKRRLAYVPDDPAPFDVLTVEEHLRFTARLYGLRDWEARADELLTRFELADRRTALGSELSRGMRQKLSFCCAWLSEPAVVLLDEPLSGLDPRGIRAARAAILELKERGAAVVLSSHLLDLIEALADRLLIIDKGEVRFDGSLDEARSAAHGASLEEVFFSITSDDVSTSGEAAPAAEDVPPPASDA